MDRMAELLLAEKGLRNSQLEDKIRSVARSPTLTILRRLDGARKASVVQFLCEAHLIARDRNIIALEGADLRGLISAS